MRKFGVVAGALAALLGVANTSQAACCYFSAKNADILQPAQKVFLTYDPQEKVESFTVQPKFEGNALDFGMVIPTPGKPKLDEMPRDFFKDLAIYTILMPLAQRIQIEEVVYKPTRAKNGDAPEPVPPNESAPHGVKVLESGVVGSLDYKIIVADDASGLFEWLKEN